MQLYKFQEEGISFARSRANCGIFDEMGLGKTVQAIMAADGSLLILCPAAARISWFRAIKSWTNRVAKICYKPRDFEPTGDGTSTFIVSYEMADRVPDWLNADVMVLDEAHYLKTRTSKRTKTVFGRNCDGMKGLSERARRVICLTGTPMPNNPSELWPMLRALAPELISERGRPLDYWSFIKKYCKTEDTGFGIKIVGGKNLAELAERIKPFFIRRKIDDTELNLPPMRTGEVYLPADGIDLRLGITVEQKAKLLESAENGKLDDPQHATLRRLLGEAKVDALVEHITRQLEDGVDKLVVFAYHRSVIEQLYERLGAFSPVMVYGGMSDTEKQASVDAFQDNPTARIAIGQITAMGTNWTLTAAAHILFAEFSWVPGDNEQAAKRCRRIGQTRPTLVQWAMLDGSVDEDMQRALGRKLNTITQVFN